ncbi:MAG: VOC family protein, partial [Gemmatimonadaceae bacterium]
YWNAIVGNGGQESECGWCKGKWGLSWQQPLVERHARGATGGGARLTRRAIRMSRVSRRINSSIYHLVERTEREILDT